MKTKDIYLKTMKFVWLKLALGFGITVAAVVLLALFMLIGSAFGGGGMYDTVVLAGVLAVCLAELIGESRERMQGGPRDENRDPSVLKNLRAAGMKGDRHHG